MRKKRVKKTVSVGQGRVSNYSYSNMKFPLYEMRDIVSAVNSISHLEDKVDFLEQLVGEDYGFSIGADRRIAKHKDLYKTVFEQLKIISTTFIITPTFYHKAECILLYIESLEEPEKSNYAKRLKDYYRKKSFTHLSSEKQKGIKKVKAELNRISNPTPQENTEVNDSIPEANVAMPVLEYPSGNVKQLYFLIESLEDANREYLALEHPKHKVIYATNLLTFPTKLQREDGTEFNPAYLPGLRENFLNLLKSESITSGVYPVFYKTLFSDGDFRPVGFDWDLMEDFVNLFGINEQEFVLQFWKYNEAEISQLDGALINPDQYENLKYAKFLHHGYSQRYKALQTVHRKVSYLESRLLQTKSSDTRMLNEQQTTIFKRVKWKGTMTELGFLVNSLIEIGLISEVAKNEDVVEDIYKEKLAKTNGKTTGSKTVKMHPKQIEKARHNVKYSDQHKPRKELTELVSELSALKTKNNGSQTKS
jgi:hypothetical protein